VRNGVSKRIGSKTTIGQAYRPRGGLTRLSGVRRRLPLAGGAGEYWDGNFGCTWFDRVWFAAGTPGGDTRPTTGVDGARGSFLVLPGFTRRPNLGLPWVERQWADGLCRPAGAKTVFWVWFYKYFAPLALGMGKTSAWQSHSSVALSRYADRRGARRCVFRAHWPEILVSPFRPAGRPSSAVRLRTGRTIQASGLCHPGFTWFYPWTVAGRVG
jgi:hypothetical protein